MIEELFLFLIILIVIILIVLMYLTAKKQRDKELVFSRLHFGKD
jgi:preprotein translocase subunit SecG